MDTNNRLLNHAVVALISAGMIYGFWQTDISLNRAIAGASFFLLFLVLIIGPVMKLWRPIADYLPWKLPWSWRGELGIWFTILAIVHLFLVLNYRQGFGTLRLSDYIGFVALFFAIVLMITSFGKVIEFIGIKSWKWLHSFAYVLFYLVGFHTINHALLRSGRPDHWMHWIYLILIIIVMALQFGAFIKTVYIHRKSLNSDKTEA